MIERFRRTLKEQCLYLHRFATLTEARRIIGEFMTRYNVERLIERLGHRPPGRSVPRPWQRDDGRRQDAIAQWRHDRRSERGRHYLDIPLGCPGNRVRYNRAVFQRGCKQRLVAAGLLKGRTVAIDATTLEANAAMCSVERRDTGESYQEFLTRLAVTAAIKTPTREALAPLDRRRKKRTSNKNWENPSDPDVKITKMKDRRMHLAHKAEHAVDLDCGALVAVTLHGADIGHPTSLVETELAAVEQVEAAHSASARSSVE